MNMIQKMRFFLMKNGVKRAEYLKAKNILKQIGDNCLYQPRNIPMDPKLVKLHDNVFIAAGVKFCTHDASRNMLSNKNNREYAMHLGCIEICDNCFIGLNSIILSDVKIEKNVIVAAGSIVTKSIPSGVVVAGNPAKIIGSFSDFENKMDAIINKKYLGLGYEELIETKWSEFDTCKKGYLK